MQKERKSSSQGKKPRPIPCRRERPAVPTLAGCSSIQEEQQDGAEEVWQLGATEDMM